MLYLWDWPESCVICSVGDRDRHQKCIVPLSAHLGPDIFAAFCLESPVYNSLAQTNEESAVAVVWIFYNLALSVFPLFHFLQLLPIVDPFEFRFQFFAASLKLFIFFPSTPNFFFLGNWPLPNQQSLNLKVVFRFYSDDDHGEWDDDDDGPWNFIKGSTFCWYTMIVLGDGFVQLQAGSWRRGISEFWPKLENLQLVQIIPLPPQRKRRMTMLLMMFLTHWLWQVGKCQQCWVEPGRATVQMCFSTTGACTQITSTNSCWLFKSSDCLVLYCCWIGRFNTETACGHHQETLSKKHPCLFWTTHSC